VAGGIPSLAHSDVRLADRRDGLGGADKGRVPHVRGEYRLASTRTHQGVDRPHAMGPKGQSVRDGGTVLRHPFRFLQSGAGQDWRVDGAFRIAEAGGLLHAPGRQAGRLVFPRRWSGPNWPSRSSGAVFSAGTLRGNRDRSRNPAPSWRATPDRSGPMVPRRSGTSCRIASSSCSDPSGASPSRS
jgi:hypothetical protein